MRHASCCGASIRATPKPALCSSATVLRAVSDSKVARWERAPIGIIRCWGLSAAPTAGARHTDTLGGDCYRRGRITVGDVNEAVLLLLLLPMLLLIAKARRVGCRAVVSPYILVGAYNPSVAASTSSSSPLPPLARRAASLVFTRWDVFEAIAATAPPLRLLLLLPAHCCGCSNGRLVERGGSVRRHWRSGACPSVRRKTREGGTASPSATSPIGWRR